LIDSDQIELRPHTLDDVRALHASAEAYERRAGLRIAEGVRQFITGPEVSEAFNARLAAGRENDEWRDGFGIIQVADNLLVGLCSYNGAPDSDGAVEISYGIAPDFNGRGYATAAAAMLVARAWAEASVRVIRAHTLPEHNASTKVLERCGFKHVGEITDPVDGLIWRWELRRDASA
jgi:RimJ/RimL family protein N-acetyltransferase